MAKIDNTQFAVIGLGRFGISLTKTLYESGAEVLAIDNDRTLVNEAQEFSTHAVCIDATDESSLKNIGLRNFDTVIVCIGGSPETSIFVTLLCKQLGIPRVIAKASCPRHKIVLEKIGADVVVFPEDYMGQKVASMLVNPNMIEIATLTPEFRIIEIVAPVKWEEKTLKQLDLRNKYGVSVLLIKRKEQVISELYPSTVIRDDDLLVICGSHDATDKLLKLTKEAVTGL